MATDRKSKLYFSPSTTDDIAAERIENNHHFGDTFFQQEKTTLQTLEFAPGVRKTYQFPTFYKDVVTTTALFTCDYSEAKSRVTDPTLKPLCIGFGRAVIAISSYHYAEVRGIGPYNEVAVSILVQPRSNPSARFSPRSINHLKSFGAFVISMPVTTKENQLRGRKIWGLPKDVMPIELKQDGDHIITTVFGADHRSLFQYTVPMTGKQEFLRKHLIVHSMLDGVSLQSPTKSQGLFFTQNSFASALCGIGKERLFITDAPEISWLRALDLNPRPFRSEFSYNANNMFGLPGSAFSEC